MSTLVASAATVTWGGAGTSGAPEFWNAPGTGSGQNGDPTHWNQATPPVTDGTDDTVLTGGGIKKNSTISFLAGSDMVMNNSSYFVVDGAGQHIRVDTGSLVTVNSGSTLAVSGDNSFYDITNGGTINLAGGTLAAIGAASNPIRAQYGIGTSAINFTELGATIQVDNFTGADLLTYLESKRPTGFFDIDGVQVAGFGAAFANGNGEYLEFTGTSSAGSLTLVAIPEPFSTALLGLGGLALILRRRK